MTLSTYVYIHDETDHAEVFRYCQGLLTDYDDEGRTPDDQRSETSKNTYNDAWSMDNACGQGLPAWLLTSYKPGEPVRATSGHDEDCDEDCSGSWHEPAYWTRINLDTAYSYRSRELNCGELHAQIVARLGAWLDSRGVDWSWRNEYTGDVHSGPDRIERLADLAGASDDATEWVRTSVLPAIAVDMAKEVAAK
jgi:hypothetical protein